MRGDSNNLANTTTIAITVTAEPSQTPNTPATIFGLSRIAFYSVIGTVAAIVAAAFLALRTKSKRLQETEPSDVRLS
jgi:hypothetical protein